MTQQSKRLAVEFGLAMAVCGVIAAFDRPLVGLVGAAICAVFFGIRAYGPVGSRLVQNPQSHTLSAPLSDDEEVANRGFGSPSYNPQNPAFPLYYPPADRD